MDIKNSHEYKYGRLRLYEIKTNNKYDYEQYGILEKCLPKILFKGNSTLVTLLQAIDVRLIMLLKYIKKLQNFKNILSE